MNNITKEVFENVLANNVTEEIDIRYSLDKLSPIFALIDYGDDTNADIGWTGQDFNYAFSEGFYQIAHFSYSRLGYESDTLVYPIFFNYRHYIELALKTHIQKFKLYYELSINTDADHDISKLLASLCKILDDNNLAFMLPDEIRNVIKEFHALDPRNTKYRYAYSQNGDLSHKYDETLISLKHLHIVMNTVHNYLFAITCFVDDVDYYSASVNQSLLVGTIFEPFLKKLIGLKFSKKLLKDLRKTSYETSSYDENEIEVSVDPHSITDNGHDLIYCVVVIKINRKEQFFYDVKLKYATKDNKEKILKSITIKINSK